MIYSKIQNIQNSLSVKDENQDRMSEEVRYNNSNKQIIKQNKVNIVDMQNKPFEYIASREINNQSIQMFDSILENSNEKSNIKKIEEISNKKNRKIKGYSGVKNKKRRFDQEPTHEEILDQEINDDLSKANNMIGDSEIISKVTPKIDSEIISDTKIIENLPVLKHPSAKRLDNIDELLECLNSKRAEMVNHFSPQK